VFADSSLRGAFATISDQFQAENPGVDVYLSFAGSSTIATQLFSTASVRADVFASADPGRMAKAVEAQRVQNPVVFARNRMAIAVPPGNPADVRTVADLAARRVKVALCNFQVPCGVASRQVLRNARVKVDPAAEESDVSAVMSRVVFEEVDAGMVYATDVMDTDGKVSGVRIPAGINASTPYPIAVLTRSVNPSAAQAFVDYVLSPKGAKALAAAGFEPR
jgi:molybdate transport system substrate-binding protein